MQIKNEKITNLIQIHVIANKKVVTYPLRDTQNLKEKRNINKYISTLTNLSDQFLNYAQVHGNEIPTRQKEADERIQIASKLQKKINKRGQNT